MKIFISSPDQIQSVSRYDFFIAYATPDRELARKLCWFLQDDACEVFLDVQDLSLGALWQPALREALEASRAIVVLVSTHTDDAFYQQEEIVRAIQLARAKPSAHTVIPVILEKLPQGAVSMPYGMSSLQAQDATRSGGLKRVATELVAWLKDHQRNTKQPQMADAMIEARKDADLETAYSHSLPVMELETDVDHPNVHPIDPMLIKNIASALGAPLARLNALLAQARRKWREEKGRSAGTMRIDQTAQASQGGLVTQALMRYYTPEKLAQGNLSLYAWRIEGESVPVEITTDIACRANWVGLSIKLGGDQEVCQLIEASSPAARVSTERVADFMAYVESMGFRVWEAPIYRLIDIEISANRLSVSFSEELFSHYRFLGGPSLMDELTQALVATDLNLEKVLGQSAELLPLHEELVPDGASLVDFRNRLCGGGIVVLCAMARPAPDHDFVVPIYRRSQSVSDSQGAFSTVPRGYHQPQVNADAERNLSFSVYRELYEELFGGEEVERGTQHYKHDWFIARSKPLQWLLDHPEAYTLECTGFGINLRLGDYTFGILLAVHDEEFYRRYSDEIRGNWEASASVGDRQLISSRDPEKLSSLTRNAAQWDGAALFAFVEGLKRLENLDKELGQRRVNLPQLERVTLNS